MTGEIFILFLKKILLDLWMPVVGTILFGFGVFCLFFCYDLWVSFVREVPWWKITFGVIGHIEILSVVLLVVICWLDDAGALDYIGDTWRNAKKEIQNKKS